MNNHLVASSNIKAIGYDPQTETLEVEFHSGSIYQYYGVPDHLHGQIMQAPSKGKFLHIYIKNQFPYSRVG